MSRMSNSEYENAKNFILDNYSYKDGASKDDYISFLKQIVNSYDDGYECAKQLDKLQSRWTVFGEYL